MQLKTILVPFDFSDYAERALSWAIGLAKDWDAKIILLHAIAPIPSVATADAMSFGALSQVDIPKMEAEMIEDALQRLQKVAEHQTTFLEEIEEKVIMSDPFWGTQSWLQKSHSASLCTTPGLPECHPRIRNARSRNFGSIYFSQTSGGSRIWPSASIMFL